MEQANGKHASGEKERNEPAMERPDYGNWVSTKLVYGPALTGIVFVGLAIGLTFLGAGGVFTALLAVIGVLFFLVSLYFGYARYLFSPGGRNVQEHVRDLVLSNLEWDGKGRALDIGCGNAYLAVKLAKKYPEALVTGIDYWGKSWEYSIGTCEKNAMIEGVSERTTFRQASASKLPFDDGSFDVVVSNLTFHEVRDARDKREVVREALRVVRNGGIFVFQDLFLMKAAYGDTDDLVRAIRGWGIKEVQFIETRNEPFIPRALKLPFMVGTIGIISGKK